MGKFLQRSCYRIDTVGAPPSGAHVDVTGKVANSA
jgi:hypothetical protein